MQQRWRQREMHVWSQMVLVWVKQVLPATSLLGLRPTSGLWSTVGIDVSVHFRLFVNTDLVMLLLLNSVDTNRVRSIWLLQSTALHIHQTTTTVTKNLADWLTGSQDWDKKGILLHMLYLSGPLPDYRYSPYNGGKVRWCICLHIHCTHLLSTQKTSWILTTFDEMMIFVIS